MTALPWQIENQKKLVAALRSGKYKQGKEMLRPSEDEYCCLGVACDIKKFRGNIKKIDKNKYETRIGDIIELTWIRIFE